MTASIVKPHTTDEEAFAAQMTKAFERVDLHIQASPLTAEDVVVDHARKDAERILGGSSVWSATSPFWRILHAGNNSSESDYYRKGKLYYAIYCDTIKKTVEASNPSRELKFLEWDEKRTD